MDSLTVKPLLSLPGGQTLQRVSYNTNGLYPALSEYIAYDTLTPPNPFIAVTQDGLGRVVYDGGFPKFYNTQHTVLHTSFTQLPGSLKYLHNAILWVMNPTKVAQGNRKVLVLGDAAAGSNSYVVGHPGPTSFTNIFNILGPILNVEFTLAPRLSSERLDWTYAQLDQYAAVFFMGSHSVGIENTLLTDNFVDAMVAYRSAGNGLIFVTDHGNNLNTIEEAATASTGFFAGANRIIVNFGAWFTGDYNRSAVNVGFIRSTYGDHPLYAGLDDSEFIPGAGSESAVRVTADNSNKVVAKDFAGFKITTPGVTQLRAAFEMVSGAVYLLEIDMDIRAVSPGLYGPRPISPVGYDRGIDVRLPLSLAAGQPTNGGSYRFDANQLSITQLSGPAGVGWFWSFKLDYLNI